VNIESPVLQNEHKLLEKNKNEHKNLKYYAQKMKYEGLKVLELENSVIYRFHDEAKVYCRRSLFFLEGSNPIRKTAAKIIDWK
jgi:arginine deiminase